MQPHIRDIATKIQYGRYRQPKYRLQQNVSGSSNLYLRLQLCTMTPDPILPNTYNLVTDPCEWFSITGSGIAITTNTNLSDQEYLNYFYYCNAAACSESCLQNLACDTSATVYARNIVMPWSAEILQMYIDNSSPENATICFAACSFPAPASAPCAYPHNLVLYLVDGEGNALLDNSVVAGFEMKGADLGTMCPSSCNVYISPTV